MRRFAGAFAALASLCAWAQDLDLESAPVEQIVVQPKAGSGLLILKCETKSGALKCLTDQDLLFASCEVENLGKQQSEAPARILGKAFACPKVSHPTALSQMYRVRLTTIGGAASEWSIEAASVEQMQKMYAREMAFIKGKQSEMSHWAVDVGGGLTTYNSASSTQVFIGAKAPLKSQLYGQFDLLYPLSATMTDSLSLGLRYQMPYLLRVGIDAGWTGLSGQRVAQTGFAVDFEAGLLSEGVKILASVRPFWLDVDTLRRNIEAELELKLLAGRRTKWGLGASANYRRELWTKGETHFGANSLGFALFFSLER